jgi:predicted nucleotidyltransferase
MNSDLIDKIAELKKKYIPEGFVILGVFGSYARGEETAESDVDILYEILEPFHKKHPGFKAVSAIEEIKNEIAAVIGKNIDFADKSALKRVGKKYILPEVHYV